METLALILELATSIADLASSIIGIVRDMRKSPNPKRSED